jgi:hypothetical protein
MNALTRADLVTLIQTQSDRCVSLYMPTEPTGREQAQNLIRYRKLVDRAETMLIEKGLSKTEAGLILEPARELQEKVIFWKALDRGLAALLSQDGFHVRHLPFECEEQCLVGRRFYVLPLVQWLNRTVSYWLLLMSQNRVRLVRVAEDVFEEVDVPGLPSSREESLNYDHREGSYQVHSGNPQLRGKEGLVFTGQGGAVDAAQAELTEFTRILAEAISKFFQGHSDPLIFVGVDNLYALYRRHNHYPQLLDKHISGNPDLYSSDELRQRAQPILDELFSLREEADIVKYWNRVGHGRATNRVEEILAAAEAGAVETLFVDPTAHRLGLFDRQAESVRIDDCLRHDSEDLVNLATVLVLQHGGNVTTPDSGNVPGGGPMSATLRYPVATGVVVATK